MQSRETFRSLDLLFLCDLPTKMVCMSRIELARCVCDAISLNQMYGIVGRVGRATARDALCRGFDPCWQCPQGVAVDFGHKQSGWLTNQLGNPILWEKVPCEVLMKSAVNLA